MKHKILVLLSLTVLLSLLAGCTFPVSAMTESRNASAVDVEDAALLASDDAMEADDDPERPDGWDETTHGKDADSDYETVFPQDEVNRIDITISDDNWQTMMDDMTAMYGEFGTRTDQRMAPGGQRPQDQQGMQSPPTQGGAQPPQMEEGMERPQMGGGNDPMQGNRQMGGGMMEDDDSNPVWVTATIEFEGDIWTNVGLRFKGNSSLKNSWSQGSYKIPLKLDFDEFEDDYPEIDDQRFYGFKQLTLASNFNDASYSREKVVAEIFNEAGVTAPQTAFYEVYVDYGEGPQYFGLYTMVEVVDDTLIETQFEDDSGNLYKPSGTGASFAADSFSEASFDKETNQDEADYSDILELYDVLHTETRTSDPEAWRASLEAVFDVSGFLNYLAVNNIVQNWDTYGLMTHNYYLYHDPATDLLTWIPWDNNEAMKTGRMKEPLSLNMDEVNERWPLISYLMDDPVYYAQYVSYVEAAIEGPLNPGTLITRLEELHELVEPYALAEEGGVSQQAFENALAELIQHVNDRYRAASAFLQSAQ